MAAVVLVVAVAVAAVHLEAVLLAETIQVLMLAPPVAALGAVATQAQTTAPLVLPLLVVVAAQSR